MNAIMAVYLAFVKTLIILVFICFTINTHAQLVTDRPDQTESSSTVGLGNLQIESGIIIGYEENENTTVRQILAPTTLFRYGISKGIELRLVSQFESLRILDHNDQGISDLEIGTKIELMSNPESKSEIAFLAHLILPTGTKDLTNDKYGMVNKLSIAHNISEQLDLGYNLGYNYYGIGDGDLSYSLALGIGVNDKVGVYIEAYGEYIEFEDFIANIDMGFTYAIKDLVQFDFSFGTGVNNNMNYISTGISILFNK